MLTDIVFVRQETKRNRAPRWRWIVDGFFFSLVTAELQRMPTDNSASIKNTQTVRFCSFNTVVFSFLFAFRARASLVFFFFFLRILWQGWQRNAPVKDFLSRKGRFNWTKNDGDAHPWRL